MVFETCIDFPLKIKSGCLKTWVLTSIIFCEMFVLACGNWFLNLIKTSIVFFSDGWLLFAVALKAALLLWALIATWWVKIIEYEDWPSNSFSVLLVITPCWRNNSTRPILLDLLCSYYILLFFSFSNFKEAKWQALKACFLLFFCLKCVLETLCLIVKRLKHCLVHSFWIDKSFTNLHEDSI